MHSAGSSYTTGEDLASLADILSELQSVFIVNSRSFVCTELAYSFSGSLLKSVEAAFSFGAFFYVFHRNFLLS